MAATPPSVLRMAPWNRTDGWTRVRTVRRGIRIGTATTSPLPAIATWVGYRSTPPGGTERKRGKDRRTERGRGRRGGGPVAERKQPLVLRLVSFESELSCQPDMPAAYVYFKVSDARSSVYSRM